MELDSTALVGRYSMAMDFLNRFSQSMCFFFTSLTSSSSESNSLTKYSLFCFFPL